MTDRLDPRAETWRRGISLEPITPQLRAEIVAIYREFARAAPNDGERAYYTALAEKWEAP